MALASVAPAEGRPITNRGRALSRGGSLGRLGSWTLVCLLAGAGLTVAESTSAGASTAAFKVSGTDNIFGAGLSVAPDPGGFGGGVVPYRAKLPRGTVTVTFSKVKGTVSYGVGSNGPDGIATSFNTDITSAGASPVSLTPASTSTSLASSSGRVNQRPLPAPSTSQTTIRSNLSTRSLARSSLSAMD